MKKTICVFVVLLAVTACTKETAPEVTDVENINVEGKPYTAKEFIEEFCQFKDAEFDPTCRLVQKHLTKLQGEIQNFEW